MTSYRILITPSAVKDIDEALCYYNARRDGLGNEFTNTVDVALQEIAVTPTAYTYRYKDVRGKYLKRFPYLILFRIDEDEKAIQVIRIFNTYQKPYWI